MVVPFLGYPDSARARSREADVVHCLHTVAERYEKIPTSTKVTVKETALNTGAKELVVSLKSYLNTEVDKHLTRIANIIFERDVVWSMVTNNCQLFANRLLMGKDFEYITPRFPGKLLNHTQGSELLDIAVAEDTVDWPRYLLSFGNHIEGFGKSFYQPNCLVTNYCQSLPTIDYDLLEHVTRLPNLSSDPYHEALGDLCRLTHNASKNSMALPVDKLWLMPNDSLSLLQMHLLRSPHKYRNAADELLKGKEWLKNRLAVLQLLDVFAAFTGALGISLFSLLVQEPKLLSQITIPPSRVLGNMRADEKLRIVRFGSRGVIYDITNRVPSAMGQVVHMKRRPSGDPIHGEEVLCRIVGFFVAPIALVSPALAKEIGGIFRLHQGFWIAVNIGGHTYITQYLGKKVKNIRD
jgi:hypothetical protein